MLRRILVVVFAAIQVLLTLRLLLPFAHLPETVRPGQPLLITVTDWLMAPFQAFAKSFDLGSVAGSDLSKVPGLASYADKLDPAVVVAMVGWGIIAAVVMFGSSLLGRAKT